MLAWQTLYPLSYFSTPPEVTRDNARIISSQVLDWEGQFTKSITDEEATYIVFIKDFHNLENNKKQIVK